MCRAGAPGSGLGTIAVDHIWVLRDYKNRKKNECNISCFGQKRLPNAKI